MEFQEKYFYLYNHIVGVNKRHTIARNRLINTTEYRKCKDEMIEMLQYQRIKMQLKSPLKICKAVLLLHSELWGGDKDNAIKIIYDALEKSGIVENDKMIIAGEQYVSYDTTNIFLPKLYQNLTKEKVNIIKIIHL